MCNIHKPAGHMWSMQPAVPKTALNIRVGLFVCPHLSYAQ